MLKQLKSGALAWRKGSACMIPAATVKLLQAEAAAQDKKDGSGSGIAHLKLFNPVGAGTWKVSEIREVEPGTWHLFGYAEIHPGCGEFGTTSLNELGAAKLQMGLAIERDCYFTPQPIQV
ncbi:unnamed protein product [marine sediment metagenome]|uniref:DUF2958 domain-containing protein n=1 Tax=marine sediment metagenome TaxID=412755 RepID=X0UG16_9ZZZZ